MEKVALIPGTPMKILLEDFIFYPSEFSLDRITVPAGFAFDGLSLPRGTCFLRQPNNNDDIIADIAHSYTYSTLCDSVSRYEGDLKLLDDTKGIGKYTIFIGLRLLGWISWKKDTNYKTYRKKIEEARKTLGLNK